ncbi:MAG: RnfABCDGE type electron transport complex subunit D [Anaerohalosphaeraceae bacterium]|nr:RnfABCDGE type electron transport complex subunit D [Anaerohalosphaeraceae bacterium]
MNQNLEISPSPHISKRHSTASVMLDVIIGLLPAIIAAGLFFRARAAIVIGVCVLSCVVSEWLCNVIRKKPNSLGDFSAVVTGIILAFSVPPLLPWWACVIGSAFAIIIGKMVFGGLGANIFNPAMVGRCFLVACFGMLMATWTVPADVRLGDVQIIAAKTQATPLAMSKEAIKAKGTEEKNAALVNKLFKNMFIGSVGGCLGETSSLALLLGGAYMLIRRTISWIIPVAVLLGAFVFASLGWLINPDVYIQPWIHLTGGGLLIGAFFIATDPVTAPLTKRGMWIFGLGIGGLTMLIRMVGEYPEGVMFAVLLMNSATPLIDRFTKRVPVGGVK